MMIADIKNEALLVVLLLVWATGAAAQTVAFEPLMQAKDVTALLEQDGVVIGGLEGGGLVFWPTGDPAQAERLPAGFELGGNTVADLAWSGRHVWVATRGGGLTRIENLTGHRSFRQYVSNLGSLEVTAVTGTMVGASERVYYGMDGGGVGLITDGLSGAVFTAEQDGLVSNIVNAVQVYGGDLFVATPAGVSRFTNNLFSTVNSGIGGLDVRDLALDSNGDLVAATSFGVFRWDPIGLVWQMVGASPEAVTKLGSDGNLLYALGSGLRVYDGVSWLALSAPPGPARALAVGTDVWLGGSRVVSAAGGYPVRNAYLARLGAGDFADVYEVSASQVLNADAVGFSGSVPYIGAAEWQSVISSRSAGVWHHDRWQNAVPGNEGARLGVGVALSMAAGPDSVMWAGLYAGTGVARLAPQSGRIDLIEPSTSGLLGKGVVNVVVHPDGPVLTLHDWSDPDDVEILVDPANWVDPNNWVVLPASGLGDGPTVWDAVVQRRDVIWFAVEAVGLVRWDLNGDLAGPNDPLTWRDQSDDRWDVPLTRINGSVADLTAVRGLAVGSDGSIWAGGNGLVQFTYDEASRWPTLVTNVGEKTSAFLGGLVNGNVSDIARDANDDIWVTTASGVNRVRGTGQKVAIDAYIDLASYFANPAYAVLYSPGVISPLPGNAYKKVAVDVSGHQILVSGDQGASLITVSDRVAANGPTLAGAYLAPNPYTGEGGGGLQLGGVASAGAVAVEIYGVDGELVYADPAVTPGAEFWAGGNLVGEMVSTGLYVVRITANGVSRALTLAVVR